MIFLKNLFFFHLKVERKKVTRIFSTISLRSYIVAMRKLTTLLLFPLLEIFSRDSFASSAAGLKGLSMGCECGEGEEGRAEEAGRGEDLLLGGDAQVRIVDGYEPKRRPWMVYLQAICFGNKNRFCHAVYTPS